MMMKEKKKRERKIRKRRAASSYNKVSDGWQVPGCYGGATTHTAWVGQGLVRGDHAMP